MSDIFYISPGDVKTNLPRSVEFVGRESEVQTILNALDINVRTWIISLTGVGGIGKTELAIRVAQILQERKAFDHIVWSTAKQKVFTEQGVKDYYPDYLLTNLEDLLDTIVIVLEMDPRILRFNIERKTSLVQDELKKSRTLIIVDNFETVNDRAVLQFLNTLPVPTKALITSRLGGFSAYGFLVPQTLEGQKEIRIGPMSEHDAIQLFVKRMSQHNFEICCTDKDETVKEAVNKAARIPLAIEWLVGQISLGKSLDLAVSELQASKGEVLSFCFDNLLSAVGRRAEKVLLAVSVFPSSVTANTLLYVTGMKKNACDEELRKLVSASLLEIEYDKSNARYNLLAPTRLLLTATWKDVLDIVESYHHSAVDYFVTQLRAANASQKWKIIENDIDNIMYLFNWSYEGGFFDQVTDLAKELSVALQRLGKWDERALVCELATQAATFLGDKKSAIAFTYDAAEVHKHRGRLEQAIQEFYRCEEYSNQVGDLKKAASARMQVGIVLFHLGKHNDANAILEHTLELHRKNNDKHGMSINYSVLGRNQLFTGNHLKAHNYFEESLKLKVSLSDQLGEAIGKYDLGRLYHLQNRLIDSEKLLLESVKLLEGLGERRHLANAKRHLAYLKMDQGELSVAKSLLIDVLYIEEELQRDLQAEETSTKLEQIDRLINKKAGLEIFEVTKFSKMVVIGIEAFAHLPTIQGAINSAKRIAYSASQRLDPNTEVIYLFNDQATSEAVKKTLSTLKQQNVLLILVSHTCQQNNRNYLCCYDTSIERIDETSIEGNELASFVRSEILKNHLFIVDGNHFEDDYLHGDKYSQLINGLSSKYFEFLAANMSGIILSAAQDGEFSYHSPNMECDLFSFYLSKGLAGAACVRNDDYVYLTDLYYFVERGIQEKMKGQKPCLFPSIQKQEVILGPKRHSVIEIKQEEKIIDSSEQDDIKENMMLREQIVNDPLTGAAELSKHLSEYEGFDKKNEVDLLRSELVRIEKIRQKFAATDPSLEVEWKRCIFRLLEICHNLIDPEK